MVGGIVASRISDADFRKEMTRKLAVFGIAGAVIGFLGLQWTLTTLPEHAREVMALRLPGWFVPSMWVTFGGIIAYLALTFVAPRILTPLLSVGAAIAVMVFGIWPEETSRESMRKPWVAGQYVYSNQVIGRDVPALGIKSDISALQAQGMLASHPFVPDGLRQVTEANKAEAGRTLALIYCSNCHNLTDTATGIRPLRKLTDGMDETALAGFISGALSSGAMPHMPHMPHMPMSEAEAGALAHYLAGAR